jgi:hypothetical protein
MPHTRHHLGMCVLMKTFRIAAGQCRDCAAASPWSVLFLQPLEGLQIIPFPMYFVECRECAAAAEAESGGGGGGQGGAKPSLHLVVLGHVDAGRSGTGGHIRDQGMHGRAGRRVLVLVKLTDLLCC